MANYRVYGSLRVAEPMALFVADEIAPGTGIEVEAFWSAYAKIIAELGPLNRELLDKRDALQQRIDSWFRERAKLGQAFDVETHKQFLGEIGYIVPEGPNFEITTTNVDAEIALVAGPQLVVPVMNARFALNAANARWGSLYDALYGTDAIAPGGPMTGGYDAARGAAVVRRAQEFLDMAVPLRGATHDQVTGFGLDADGGLVITLAGGIKAELEQPEAFIGHREDGRQMAYLFRHHGLHIEIVVDPGHPVGKASPAGVRDVVVEAAVTTIQDCEDSVAAVDVDDKVAVYRNWLGLMRGDLETIFLKNGQPVARRLLPDRTYTGRNGKRFSLPGRSLMLVRNVGHLMTTDAVLDSEGRETPEGFLDAVVTAFAALHDLQRSDGPRNSRTGSIYIVKPKMHGPEEVALANTLFDRVEDALGLERNTIKIGVMDEERRTSVNLKEAIRAVRERVVFINTGFLDRTGDEIHTSMQLGPMVPKNEIKGTGWISAYEDNNVDIGLETGLGGRAQIGKGMWAKPDAMAEMLAAKIGHPLAGGSTAWVPSPTAAVLHALHYHQVDVAARQHEISSRSRTSLDQMLTPPLLGGRNLSEEEIRHEIDNNCQSILGYVVRWIDQGIGCSKVPDVNNVALMEDRATLRISSQHLANWIAHGIISGEAVVESLRRMSAIVDQQNAGDPEYRPMAPQGRDSFAFRAAADLIFEGANEPSGYTEPILHRWRRQAKHSSTMENFSADHQAN